MDLLQGEIDSLESSVHETETKRSDLLAEESQEKEARELLLAISDYVLESDPTKAMTTVITDILRRLFGEDIISFNIETVEKRRQLETYFTITRRYGKHEVTQPILSSSGVGIADVAFMLIRIILLVNDPSKPRRILWADEPMKNLSADKREAFMDLLKQICDEFDLQIFMSTHEDAYVENADHVIRFELKKGATVAKVVSQ